MSSFSQQKLQKPAHRNRERRFGGGNKKGENPRGEKVTHRVQELRDELRVLTAGPKYQSKKKRSDYIFHRLDGAIGRTPNDATGLSYSLGDGSKGRYRLQEITLQLGPVLFHLRKACNTGHSGYVST